MAFQMGYSKDELSGAPPVPSGSYTLMLKGFKPKASKVKPGQSVPESWNMNAECVIIGKPEYENRRVFVGLNSKGGWIIFDFVHSCGMPMDVAQDEFTGTEKENLTLPGVWEDSDKYPDDPSKWKYQGPLLNKTLQVELAEIPAKDGYKAKNEVRQFICAVPGCQEKHSTNLIKS